MNNNNTYVDPHRGSFEKELEALATNSGKKQGVNDPQYEKIEEEIRALVLDSENKKINDDINSDDTINNASPYNTDTLHGKDITLDAIENNTIETLLNKESKAFIYDSEMEHKCDDIDQPYVTFFHSFSSDEKETEQKIEIYHNIISAEPKKKFLISQKKNVFLHY